MPFPIILPEFYRDLVDGITLKPEDTDYCDTFVSAAFVEYVMYLSEVKVVKKLMEITEPLGFIKLSLSEEDEKKALSMSRDIIATNPVTQYYQQVRALIMNTLQNKAYSFEKRMLLLNYALKKLNGMALKNQPELIPGFVTEFTELSDYEDKLVYFQELRPEPKFAFADGISLLKSLSKTAFGYSEVLDAVYSNLGITQETLNSIDFDRYLKLRGDFSGTYLRDTSGGISGDKSHYIENIMVNYVWTYSIPFAYIGTLSIWDNYVFFCSLYNALKVLITCYAPKNDGDFAFAVSAFDAALRKTGGDIAVKLVQAVKNAGQDNNGDLAILVIS